MATQVVYPHITRKEGEPARFENHPRVRVSHIVTAHVNWGWSAAEISRHYPFLTLAEVHAALAYYFDNQAEMDAEAARDVEEIEEARGKLPPSPFDLRMKAAVKQ